MLKNQVQVHISMQNSSSKIFKQCPKVSSSSLVPKQRLQEHNKKDNIETFFFAEVEYNKI